jgi:uncharacterized tellurite resistance protein B-like protein
MNIDSFSETQRQGLLDLIVLAMYTDGNLALAEASCVERLLAAMGFATAYDRQKQFDASVTRVRQHSSSVAATASYAAELTKHFTTPDQRSQVCAQIGELMSSDNQVSAAETRFLNQVRQGFQSFGT